MRNRKHFTTMLASTRQPYCYVLVTPPNKCLQDPLPCKCQYPLQKLFCQTTDCSIKYGNDNFSFPIGAKSYTLGIGRGKALVCFFRRQGLLKARGLHAGALLFLFPQRFQEGLGFFRGSFRQVRGKAHPK